MYLKGKMQSTLMGEKQTGLDLKSVTNNHHRNLVWVDVLKALALAWIFLNHIVEQIFGSPYIGNPGFGWQPLSERIAQLSPLTGSGWFDLPINFARYAGWLGDQAVGIFILMSGFGLTWGLLRRAAPAKLALSTFYQRRFLRVYPLWIGAHILFALIALPTGLGIRFTQSAFYLSLLGDRFYPAYLFYYFAPAWWFFGLLLQLYLIYPFLWQALQKWGPIKFLIAAIVLGLAARAIGIFVFQTYIDMWLRGSVFITRLPEFAAGMSAAMLLWLRPAEFARSLDRVLTVIAMAATYLCATASELTWAGNVAAPFLTSFALSGLGFTAFRHFPANGLIHTVIAWTSKHSLSLFLTHHPVILLLFSQNEKPPMVSFPLGVSILIAIGLTIGLALLLEVLVTLGLRAGRTGWSLLMTARRLD
jgi:peptidoglycan/LPS O-acetylase OafA/YrhL